MPLNSLSPRNPFRDGLRCRKSSANLSWDSPAPPRLPRRRFRAHSGEEPRAPPARPLQIPARLAPHPHEQKSPSTREPSPRPTSTAPLGPHSPPRWPGPSTYVTAEGNGSSDEGPINKDWKSVRVKASRQPAAIFAIEDQSRFPPQPGEGPVLETAGGEGAGSARPTGVRGLARPRRWPGRGLARGCRRG